MAKVKLKVISGSVNDVTVGNIVEVDAKDVDWLVDSGFAEKLASTPRRTSATKQSDKE